MYARRNWINEMWLMDDWRRKICHDDFLAELLWCLYLAAPERLQEPMFSVQYNVCHYGYFIFTDFDQTWH